MVEGEGSEKVSLGLPLLLTTISGLTTGLGGLFIVYMPVTNSIHSLGLSQGAAAGFMCAVTLIEIIPEVLIALSASTILLWGLVGAGGIYALKTCIPEPDLTSFISGFKIGDGEDTQHLSRVLWSGFLMAGCLAVHNLPEGVAVSVASLNGLEFGIPLTIAIASHNIPEGCAVASPIYYATRDKRKAILFALLSGLAEPLGVIVVYMIGPARLTPYVVASLLAAVGGVMIGLSLIELIPQAARLTSPRDAFLSFGGGGAAMAIILGLVNSLGLTSS